MSGAAVIATLVRHSFRRRRGLLISIGVTVVAFQFFMVLAARNLEQAGGFRQIEVLLPAFMKQWSNMMAASFAGFVLFGYLHPLVQLFLIATAISIGTEGASEIETRFVDLLMARPLRRSAPVNRTMVMLITATIGVVSAMLLATWLGLRWLAPATARLPGTTIVVSMAANLALLVIAWGAIATAIASAAKRRSTAAAAAGLLAFASFVLDYVGRFWTAALPFARVSPFHYFDPFRMMGGQPLPWTDVAVLAGISAVSWVIAAICYARRDL